MYKLCEVFDDLRKNIFQDGCCEYGAMLINEISESNVTPRSNPLNYERIHIFLNDIIEKVNKLAEEIAQDDSILVSVKDQKLLRTCFQLVTSLGVLPCLIPGLGVSLDKRSTVTAALPPIVLNDEKKYEILVECTNFFMKCYSIPVLKNIILTSHLSDYLAALIQLSFAPLKKPGTYKNFTMSEELYAKLLHDRQKYAKAYDSLVSSCFQPILMKELLVLQSVVNPPPPAFVKRIVSKEMSLRLLAPGGLLSLTRCFIESYEIDTGFDWKKVDMIRRIITAKHGNGSEDEYLRNICGQLTQMLALNNMHYLATAVACSLSLSEKYSDSLPVINLTKDIFQAFDYNHFLSEDSLPGTVLLTPVEVEHKIAILEACVGTVKLEWPVKLLLPNLFVIFCIGLRCDRNEELRNKTSNIILKCFEQCEKQNVTALVKTFLFGQGEPATKNIEIKKYESGVAVKCARSASDYPWNEALLYFLDLFKESSENLFVQATFELALELLIELTDERKQRSNKELLGLEDDPELLDCLDEKYSCVLQLLSEISTSPKVLSSLKKNPVAVTDFVKHFLLQNSSKTNEECITVALVLLNTVLEGTVKGKSTLFTDLIPVLRGMAENDTGFISILCKEALSFISTEHYIAQPETPCQKAITDVFDNLLPVRAHGIIELTRLIEAKDSEAVSKKHYLFCLFQEQLKDPDSYIYLSAINGISALGSHCSEDVLQILCKEFIDANLREKSLDSADECEKLLELRMKVGDVIVKVTKKLGEMAIIHKSLLLNTMLCGCRDPEPLIRTSALSNLAEIVIVLHYKIGSILQEVLLCIWGILETDQAIDCRRAAVMVISSLLKGLGKDTLVQLKDDLLPIYRTLKSLYNDPSEDSVLKLHAQLALEELNDIVNQFLFPEVKMERQIFVLDKPETVYK